MCSHTRSLIHFNWIQLDLSFSFFSLFYFSLLRNFNWNHSRSHWNSSQFHHFFFSLLLPRCTFTLLHFKLLYSHQLYSIDLFLSGYVQLRELFLYGREKKEKKLMRIYFVWIYLRSHHKLKFSNFPLGENFPAIFHQFFRFWKSSCFWCVFWAPQLTHTQKLKQRN